MTSRSDEAPVVPYPTEDELRRSAPVEGTVVYVPSAHNNCATETPVTVTADGGVTLPAGRCPGCGYAFTPPEVVALEQAALAIPELMIRARFPDAECAYDHATGEWQVVGDDRDRSQGPGWPDAAGPVVLGRGPTVFAAWLDAYTVHGEG